VDVSNDPDRPTRSIDVRMAGSRDDQFTCGRQLKTGMGQHRVFLICGLDQHRRMADKVDHGPRLSLRVLGHVARAALDGAGAE
jgi:hypothetical protein